MTHNRWIAIKPRLPGIVATALVIVTTSLWVFWGSAEMYYEGWGNPLPLPLAYLIPGVACLVFTLVALRWPRLGGWLLIAVGVLFTIWWSILASNRGWFGMRWALTTFPVSGMLALTGALFLMEARYQGRLRAEGRQPDPRWWRRNLRYLIACGVPLAIFAAVSAYHVPILLQRVDDGDRGARLIEGNGVTLVWAPEGPGWNWKQDFGGYPSWNSLALYGVEPIGLKNAGDAVQDVLATEEDMRQTGLCAYLDESGTQLEDRPRHIWRMPTVEEVARSLTLHNENAGCVPREDPEEPGAYASGSMDCKLKPDKETPLWAPDREPVYYWTADEHGQEDAYYVSYNGSVESQNKTWGNPRHGYRCVKEP